MFTPVLFLRFLLDVLIKKIYVKCSRQRLPYFQTIRSCALCFQFSSRCLGLWWNAVTRSLVFDISLPGLGFVKFNSFLKTHLRHRHTCKTLILRVSRGCVLRVTRTEMMFVLSSQLQQRGRGWLCSSSCVWSFILRSGIWILAEINYASYHLFTAAAMNLIFTSTCIFLINRARRPYRGNIDPRSW